MLSQASEEIIFQKRLKILTINTYLFLLMCQSPRHRTPRRQFPPLSKFPYYRGTSLRLLHEVMIPCLIIKTDDGNERDLIYIFHSIFLTNSTTVLLEGGQ